MGMAGRAGLFKVLRQGLEFVHGTCASGAIQSRQAWSSNTKKPPILFWRKPKRLMHAHTVFRRIVPGASSV